MNWRCSANSRDALKAATSTENFFSEISESIVAGEEIRQEILKTGIRKVERETKVSHHTIDRFLKGESVRRKTLAKIVTQIQRISETSIRAGL